MHMLKQYLHGAGKELLARSKTLVDLLEGLLADEDALISMESAAQDSLEAMLLQAHLLKFELLNLAD